MKVAVCLHGLARGSAVKADGAYAEKFKYLKDKVESYDVDYFIHTWDTDLEEELTNIFSPKKSIYEPQVNFDAEMAQLREPERYHSNNNGDLFKTLSFTYSRMKSVELKSQHEKELGFKYDCVLIARFDVGHHNDGRNKTSKLQFDPGQKMNKIHQAYWDQTNAGVTDHWFYGSSPLMDKVADIYNHIIDYLQPDSEYVRVSNFGWTLSNSTDEFSNEMFKPLQQRATRLQVRGPWWQLNNHCLYKWHFMKMGCWNTKKSVFHGKELWT